MTRFVDILQFHDGTEGPVGHPYRCVEHDGTRRLQAGEVRLTVDEYRALWELDPARVAERQRWASTRGRADPPQPPRRITSLAFLDRLPIERQAEIVAAARVLATQGQPLPDLLLTRLGAATEIDLDDPRVEQGVAAFREAKLINEAEAAALLADPRPDEVP